MKTNNSTITIDQFNAIAIKIQKAQTMNSWSYADGDEMNYVWAANNRAGQSWFYTTVFGDFGEAEEPTSEIIELGREEPGFCGLPEFKPTLQIYKDGNTIRVTIDDHNLVAKLSKL